MFLRPPFSSVTLLLLLSTACHAVQPSAPEAVPAPLRDLTWGQLNFLHTTDTHGWLAGHLQEASYCADWGDYVSFAARMREKAESQGQDLLVIDTGDRVEGNGLYDSSEPKGVYISDILRHQHIDLITVGNHELYKRNTSEAEFFTTVPNFRGSYLASNLDIIHPSTKEPMPFAPRFKKFTTRNQGIRIVAFGFIFDFTKNDNNTVVQPVEEAIKEEWFQEAIQDKEVDIFLVIGHVPVNSKESQAIFHEIRSARWDTPIQFLGGHFHIRDYVRYDSRAYGLASGRFMETIGFMSVDGLSTGNLQDKSAVATPSFNRKYIDNNLFSFHHHTGLNKTTFPTELGQNVSQLIAQSRSALELDKVYGCAPRNLWLSAAQYPGNDSIYTWLEEQVIPDSVKDESRGGKPALVVVNTGAIRFDIFKGPFTQDTTFIVSPFTSGLRYLKDVPHHKAKQIVKVLNKQAQIFAQTPEQSSDLIWTLAPPEQSAYVHDTTSESNSVWDSQAAPNILRDQMALSYHDVAPQILPGYITIDAGGTDGDDTVHSPIPFYPVPNCLGTLISNTTDVPDNVDLVYIDFIESYVAMAAKYVNLDVDFSHDSDVYMPGMSFTSVILNWVKDNWNCDKA